MLCIPDSTTNNWIANQISLNGYSYSWIGYSDLPNNDGNYEWVSRCSSSYSNNGYSNNYYYYDCVYLQTNNRVWYSSSDSGSSSIACSCEYSIVPTSLPTLSPTSPTVNPTTTEPSLAPSTITPSVGCQVGWSYYNNNCYKFNIGSYFSWSGCKSLCSSQGASMLCIPDSTTNTWITNQISQQGYSNSWIGYSDLPNNDGNYEWVSGCSSSYSNSAYGNNYYYYDCVYISAYSGYYWYSSSYYCDSFSSSSIACSCQYSIAPTSLPTLSPTSPTIIPTHIPTTITSSSPPTITPSVSCQVGWSYNNNKCYKFNVGTGYSWSGCKSECSSLGASMLCIPDSTTNTWIANQISQLGYSYSWIGYSDLPNNDGNYEWVSGCSSSYSNSAYGNNYYYNDCVYIYAYSGYYWYSSSYYCDSFSSSSIACSCEYPIVPTSLPTLSPTSPTVNPSLIPTTIPSSSPPTITPTVGCHVGWILYNNNCYKLNVGYYFSWSGCKSQCASMNASMLCIPDSTTNTWIANQIYQLGYSYSWIGYSDLPYQDGNYEWVSGCSSSYSNSAYGINYYEADCAHIQAYDGFWYSSYDSGYSSIACSCEYPMSSTVYPSPSTRSGYNASAIIGIVVGCVVFAIIVILILIYFFCKRTNPVCISTINESPSNNDNIRSSDQAYTDIPPTCPYPPSDDNDDIDGVVPISSTTIELQVIVASDAYYNDDVPMDHEQELLPIAVQV